MAETKFATCQWCGKVITGPACTNPVCQHLKKEKTPSRGKGLAFLLLFGSFAWLIGFAIATGSIKASPGDAVFSLIVSVWLLGFVLLFVSGGGVWAHAKGYPAVLGILLTFFLSWIGLLILTFLPDETKNYH